MSDPFTHDEAGTTTLWPPGTVRLEDLNRSAGRDIILHPRPTTDPNDPLNWPNRRKYWNFGLAVLYVAMVAEFINASTPTWGPMNKQLGYSYTILNDSYAVGCAALGLGSLLLIPVALKFGRRPVYIFSTVLQFALSIWSAKMETVADLMVINILQCFFGSLAETIVQMTIADLFFVHQRGRMNGLYIWVYLLATYMGSFIAGYVAKGQGWRWVWWWNAVFFGVCVFIVVFGYEETKYIPPLNASSPPAVTTEIENPPTTASPEHLTSEKEANIAEGNSSIDGPTKTGSSPVLKPSLSLQASRDDRPGNIYHITIDPNIPMKTYWQRLALTTTTSGAGVPHNSFIRHMYQPLILLVTIPGIGYAALVYGILVGLGDIMSTTLSTYLPQAPYNFNSDQVGLMALPRMIGVSIGALVVGPISDWWIVYFSRTKNGGVYDPETRLWCIMPFLPFIPAGALLFGIGLSHHVAWPVIAVGLALYSIGLAAIQSLVITYVTDSYKEVIGDALVAVTVIRNSFSTAFVFALTPWVAAVSIQWVLVTILLIACLILSGLGIFIKYGKTFRDRCAATYEYYAQRQYQERV
ncbi:hypothetical protein A1O1_05706 [Capronia coronata CBS 617.96]|uniref:Major facilitator superfamily (MFS) profile domain-containing protein n=1 Tax=Capronia coronata CBS 617.96 TaxID=1182541 RepID=W9XXW3_9EURO|nr:uncharacterized protein A1O1_05706 [Capronia coronata CBS 617.96]EXJ85342.1 hypothetical protein A1O1_05706 [Capronia coronata CBS 617.96]